MRKRLWLDQWRQALDFIHPRVAQLRWLAIKRGFNQRLLENKWCGFYFIDALFFRQNNSGNKKRANAHYLSGGSVKLIITVLAMLSWGLMPVAEAATEQQNKMVTCNKEATGKKGDERKAFMKECLSKKPAAPAAADKPAAPAAPAATDKPAAPAAPAATEKPASAQQNKMATCNKEATGKTGDERKKFMSECLKAK